MGLLLSTRRALLGGVGDYNDLVLGTGPVAYWPQNEASGTVANCLVNPAQNGTYTGVTLANDATGPFGTPAPFYDGTNDYCNIYSAALVAAFSGAAGSAMVWVKVNAAGVWEDAAVRTFLSLLADNDNNIWMRKHSANDTIRAAYEAAATLELATITPLTTTDWMCWAITWSKAAEEVRVYLDAAQQGATMAALGIWAGNLSNTQTLMGASSTAPATPWHGWLGPCAIWDRALPPGEVASLYVT